MRGVRQDPAAGRRPAPPQAAVDRQPLIGIFGRQLVPQALRAAWPSAGTLGARPATGIAQFLQDTPWVRAAQRLQIGSPSTGGGDRQGYDEEQREQPPGGHGGSTGG